VLSINTSLILGALSKHMEELADERPTDASGRRLIWTYGNNDHMDELPADKLKEFKATGSFRADFACLSAKCGIVTHPGFAPLERNSRLTPDNGADKAKEGSVLTLHSILVGRAAMLTFKHALATSLHLEVIRLTSCCLDAEALGMLRAGMTEACSVAVLQIDWNPVELPVDAVAFKAAFEAGQPVEIDALEQKRERQQEERSLRAFGEMLTSRFGDIATAMKAFHRAVIADRMQHEATAGIEPFPLSTWADAFHTVLGKNTAEAESIFSIIDGPHFGNGDGLSSFDSLETILQDLPPAVAEADAADPVGKAFGAFVDGSSPLDVVSFRHCNLGRLECVALGSSLGHSTHLRGLNLWGNNICDLGVAALAESFEVYYGLQFLGLGRNSITQVGLETLCAPLGFTRVDAKAQADQILKDIKDKGKDAGKGKDKKGAPPVVKKDRSGADRYLPEAYTPTCEQFSDAAGEYWLWGRNMTLKTLNLEHNPITDAAAVMRLQSGGVGEILLKGVPCAEELSRLLAEAASQRAAASPKPEGDPALAEADQKAEAPDPREEASGWRFILR